MVSEYTYSQKDLLEHPQKYQKSPFEGIDFLKLYKKNRMDILGMRELTSFSLHDFLKDFKITKNSNSAKFKLEDHLIHLLSQSDTNHVKNQVDQLLKKFEIKKKLFTEYNSDFKEISNNYLHLKNYILFAILCIIQYEKYSSLKYLNVCLKINDILCSQTSKISEEDKPLLGNLITRELEHVEKLCRKKGIEI